MPAISNEKTELLYKKRDLYASATLCACYLFSFLSKTELGYLFCSLFLFHFIVMYIVVKRKKLFGIDKMHLLAPTLLIGALCYTLIAKGITPGSLKIAIENNTISWFFMGILPAFITRGFNHWLGLTSIENKLRDKL